MGELRPLNLRCKNRAGILIEVLCQQNAKSQKASKNKGLSHIESPGLGDFRYKAFNGVGRGSMRTLDSSRVYLASPAKKISTEVWTRLTSLDLLPSKQPLTTQP